MTLPKLLTFGVFAASLAALVAFVALYACLRSPAWAFGSAALEAWRGK